MIQLDTDNKKRRRKGEGGSDLKIHVLVANPLIKLICYTAHDVSCMFARWHCTWRFVGIITRWNLFCDQSRNTKSHQKSEFNKVRFAPKTHIVVYLDMSWCSSIHVDMVITTGFPGTLAHTITILVLDCPDKLDFNWFVSKWMQSYMR